MSTEQMRQAIFDAYYSVSWQNKVRKMSDSQVFAVYTRLKNNHKI